MGPGARMRALYDYEAQNADELSFHFDDVIIITQPTGPVRLHARSPAALDTHCFPYRSQVEPGWLYCKLETGEHGKVPGWSSIIIGEAKQEKKRRTKEKKNKNKNKNKKKNHGKGKHF